MSAYADGNKSVDDIFKSRWRTATTVISLSLPDLFRQSMASAKLAFAVNVPIMSPNPNSHARVNPINILSVTVRF